MNALELYEEVFEYTLTYHPRGWKLHELVSVMERCASLRGISLSRENAQHIAKVHLDWFNSDLSGEEAYHEIVYLKLISMEL